MKSPGNTSYNNIYISTHSIPFFRRIDINRISKIVANHKTAGDLLEIGCGDGLLARAFSRTFTVYATDISESAIKRSSKWIDADRLRVSDIENEDIIGKYDIILALNVLEHLKHPRRALSKITNALKDDGIFVFAAPNNYGLYGSTATRIMNIFDKTHISTLKRSEWMRLFTEYGMYPAELINGTQFGLTHNNLARHFSSTVIMVLKHSK